MTPHSSRMTKTLLMMKPIKREKKRKMTKKRRKRNPRKLMVNKTGNPTDMPMEEQQWMPLSSKTMATGMRRKSLTLTVEEYSQL